MSRADILTDFLERLRGAGIDIPDEPAYAVERTMRLDYGGQRIHVAKRPPDLSDRIVRALDQGAALETVCRRYGCSRATVFRARIRR